MEELKNTVEEKVDEVVANSVVDVVEEACVNPGISLLKAGLIGVAIVGVVGLGAYLWDKHQGKKATDATDNAACAEAPTEADEENA